MNKKLQLALGIAAGISLAACGASSTNPTAPSNPAPVAQNVLQFAVGTAYLAGPDTTALNVVATYRQPSGSYKPGDSGTLLNSVTISGLGSVPSPAGAATGYDPLSTAPSGAGPADVGTGALTSSSQNPGTSTVTTFGQSGGVFGLGIEPYNAIGPASVQGATYPGTINSPFQVAPYPVPLLDTVAKDPNAFVPWGGPPSFTLPNSNGQSPVGNELYPGGTAGLSEGLDVLYGVTPTAGATYTLAVNVPANTGSTNATKTATLSAVTTLAAAQNPAFTPDGKGGGTFALTLPPGATEAYLQVTDFGAAAAGATPVYYTLEAATSGTLTLPDAIGPGGAPSVAAGDQLVVQVVAFDYPAFEMSYPNSNGNASPAITGTAGTDDLSVSAATCTIVGGADCTSSLPLLKQREFAAAYGHRHATAQAVRRTTTKH